MRYKRYVVMSILVFIFSLTGCTTEAKVESAASLLDKKQIITDIFIQAVTSKDGYSDPISQYLSENLFEKINYNQNSLYEEYDIKFEPSEVNTKVESGNIYIYYKYDLEVTEKDSDSVILMRYNVPALLEVTMKNESIVIINETEYMDGDIIPDEFTDLN